LDLKECDSSEFSTKQMFNEVISNFETVNQKI